MSAPPRTPGRVLAAWLFGYVPQDIREDVDRKQPGTYIRAFKRGTSIDLSQQHPASAFVACPELGGWLELRKLPGQGWLIARQLRWSDCWRWATEADLREALPLLWSGLKPWTLREMPLRWSPARGRRRIS